jgi:DNA-binding MarR family transcriptional regulator
MIAELLEILGITKQSLNRVLKELLDTGYVESRPGVSDRRQRRLYPTAKGRRLTMDLSDLQSRRFERALGELPDGARAKAVDFLFAMIEPSARDKVASLVWTGERGTGEETG